MMFYRIFLFYSCIVFFIQCSYAQQTFVLSYDTTGFIPESIVEDNGSFIFAGGEKPKVNSAGFWQFDSIVIVKWNINGDSIVKKLAPPNIENIWVLELCKKNNNGYLLTASLNSYIPHTLPDTTAFYMVSLNNNLEIEWEIIRKMPDENGLENAHIMPLKDGKWIGFFTIWGNTINNNFFPHDYMFEFTEQGEILKFKSVDTFAKAEKIMVRPDNNGYYLFGGFADPNTVHSYAVSLLIDTNLNEMGRKYFFPAGTCQWLYFNYLNYKSDTILIAASKNISYSDIGFYKVVDKPDKFQVIEDYSIYRATDDENSKNGLVRSKNGDYYVIGHIDAFNTSKVWIGCYDSLFNLKFQRIFSLPDTAIKCGSPIATSDGGLAVHFYYCYQTFFNGYSRSSFIKLDSNLQMVWEKPLNFNIIKEKGFVFPNPATSKIEIKNINLLAEKKYHYFIYNMHGQEVLSGLMFANDKTINIEKLTSGSYFISIKNEQQSIFNSIFLKN